MKTVVYYEWVRKGRSYIIRCVLYLLIILLFFVITMICEKLFPEFSYNYMNWPQYIRNIIGMRSWHRILWLNIWQIGCIIFAFIINYFSMSELAESIINEKKRETYVYLFNAGVKKSDIIFGKFIFYFFKYQIEILSQFMLNAICFVIINARLNMYLVVSYHLVMLLIGFVNLSFAVLFAVIANKSIISAKNYINMFIFGLFFIDRIPAIFSFVGSFMSEYNVTGVIIDKLDLLSRSLAGIGDICPIAWCQPYFKVSGIHIIYGMVLGIMVLIVSTVLYNDNSFWRHA